MAGIEQKMYEHKTNLWEGGVLLFIMFEGQGDKSDHVSRDYGRGQWDHYNPRMTAG